MHTTRLAFVRAFCMAGSSSANRIAMTAMTTSNSTRVNARTRHPRAPVTGLPTLMSPHYTSCHSNYKPDHRVDCGTAAGFSDCHPERSEPSLTRRRCRVRQRSLSYRIWIPRRTTEILRLAQNDKHVFDDRGIKMHFQPIYCGTTAPVAVFSRQSGASWTIRTPSKIRPHPASARAVSVCWRIR